MSSAFPTTPGAFQTVASGISDAIVAQFDPAAPPAAQLLWSTHFGGQGQEIAFDVAVDAAGSEVTFCGSTTSAQMPTTANAEQPVRGGGFDGFLARLSQNGSTLAYSTYSGNVFDERILRLSVDAQGVITFGGYGGPSLRMRGNPFQSTFRGGQRDVYVGRLDPNLPPAQQLLHQGYLGGSDNEGLGFGAIPINQTFFGMHVRGDVVAITCQTFSANYPVTAATAFQATNAGGWDGTLTVLDLAQQGSAQLVYSSYLGGAAVGSGFGEDAPFAIDAHPGGGYVIGGLANRTTLPTTPGAFNTTSTSGAFLHWLDPALPPPQQLRYGTFLGSVPGGDGLSRLHVESSGIVAFGMDAADPALATPGAFRTVHPSAGVTTAGCVGRLAMAGGGVADLHYFTYLGAGPQLHPFPLGTLTLDVHFGADAILTVAGYTTDAMYPVPNGASTTWAGLFDGVVVRVDPMPASAVRAGPSTPACAGPIYCSVNSEPAPGNAAFEIAATNAPPNAIGAIVLGTAITPPVPVLGILAHLDPGTAAVGPVVVADGLGHARLPLPLPNVPLVTVPLQWLFVTTPQCTNGGFLCASERIDIL